MNVKFSLRGVKEVKQFIENTQRGVKRVAMEAFAEYIIGNDARGLKHYPPRVRHGADNPYQWQSEKQRRAYFATDGFGHGIPYKRTNTLKEAWTFKTLDSNYTQTAIENTSGYAGFVQGVTGKGQQRGHTADGWREYMKVVWDNLNGAIKYAGKAVDDWMKKK